jgi:hypothetical protein
MDKSQASAFARKHKLYALFGNFSHAQQGQLSPMPGEQTVWV